METIRFLVPHFHCFKIYTDNTLLIFHAWENSCPLPSSWRATEYVWVTEASFFPANILMIRLFHL